MATDQLPDGQQDQEYAVVFALYPGDPEFYTIVERDSESGGAPAGSPTTVAWLPPGQRHYIERQNATSAFRYYRFRHGGYGYQFGTPTAWYRARPVPWNGTIPNIPREPLLDLDLALDDSDGTVDLVANGGRQVASIVYDAGTTDYASLSPSTSADTDSDGDVTVSDVFTLTGGQTGYVEVEFYDQTSGGGNLLGSLRASVTRPVGVGGSGALILNGDFESATDGAFWGQDGTECAIDSSTPISGSKSLELTTRGDDVICRQVTKPGGLTGGSSNARFIQVSPGDTFACGCAGDGFSDAKIGLIAIEYDEDQSQTGFTTVAAFGATGGAIEAVDIGYTVPASVRYINWAVRTESDTSNPRTCRMDNINVRRTDEIVSGIPSGLSSGGIRLLKPSQVKVDSSGGASGSDPGYIYWSPNEWRYIHPNGNKYTVSADQVTFVSSDGTVRNSASILLFVGSNESRFTDLADTDMREIVGIRKSRASGWQYLGDSGWNDFTPIANDAILAEPILTVDDEQ